MPAIRTPPTGGRTHTGRLFDRSAHHPADAGASPAAESCRGASRFTPVAGGCSWRISTATLSRCSGSTRGPDDWPPPGDLLPCRARMGSSTPVRDSNCLTMKRSGSCGLTFNQCLSGCICSTSPSGATLCDIICMTIYDLCLILAMCDGIDGLIPYRSRRLRCRSIGARRSRARSASAASRSSASMPWRPGEHLRRRPDDAHPNVSRGGASAG